MDTWDYQWQLAVWYYNCKSVIPNKNLIKNIGFGADATHTKFRNVLLETMKASILKTFDAPSISLIDGAVDNEYYHNIFVQNPKLKDKFIARVVKKHSIGLLKSKVDS